MLFASHNCEHRSRCWRVVECLLAFLDSLWIPFFGRGICRVLSFCLRRVSVRSKKALTERRSCDRLFLKGVFEMAKFDHLAKRVHGSREKVGSERLNGLGKRESSIRNAASGFWRTFGFEELEKILNTSLHLFGKKKASTATWSLWRQNVFKWEQNCLVGLCKKWSTLKIDDWSLSEERVSCLVLRTKSLRLLQFLPFFLSLSLVAVSVSAIRNWSCSTFLWPKFFDHICGQLCQRETWMCSSDSSQDSLVPPHLHLLKTLSLQFEASRPRTLLFNICLHLTFFRPSLFFCSKCFNSFVNSFSFRVTFYALSSYLLWLLSILWVLPT